MLKFLQALPMKKPALITGDGIIVKAIINIELTKDVYDVKVEKYKKKLHDFDDKYSQTCAIIWLSCDNVFYVYIKGIKSPHKIL